jgi:hypothetical protein
VPKIVHYILYAATLLVGLVAMYSILNAGNPDSLVRSVFPDPRSDIYVAAVSSFLVFVLGFVVFFNKDREGYRNLLEMNAGRIRAMREAGESDEAIAASILSAMGSVHGYRHRMAQKKLLIYLSEFQ